MGGNGWRHSLQLGQGPQRLRREEGPADGGAGRLPVRCPDGEFHHSCHRLQRASRRGLLLSILLGPHAALLTIASVLVVQALFFADGGLLALGCNIFNMGIVPAFIVYPLFYRKFAGTSPGPGRLKAAIIVSALIGLQLGPFCVVLETWLSGVSSLPFGTFLLLMQPIHLPIGVAEGIITASIVSFLHKARPEILADSSGERSYSFRSIALTLLVAALLTGGVLSWYASKNPDGLEWAIAKVTGTEDLKGPEQGLHGLLASIQERIAFLPDYTFRKPKPETQGAAASHGPDRNGEGNKLGTSASGIIGGIITLTIVFLVGFVLKRRSPAL